MEAAPPRVFAQAEPLDRRLRPPVPEADPVLQLQTDDPDARTALEIYRSEPNQTNSFALSHALIEAQERRGVPQEQRTPVTAQEAREWAQPVIDAPPDQRLRAIRSLAIRLQAVHGRHADLALKTIARSWAGDARATAYTDFLIGRLDTAAVLGDGNAEAAATSGAFLTGHATPVGIHPRNADRFAELQHTTADVRDGEGNFIRGEPLGEAVTDSRGTVGFHIADGIARAIDKTHHVVLFDPQTESWWVFNRLLRNDSFDRPILLPGPVENERTGERTLGAPDIADVLAEAAMLPGDVAAGLIDPLSDQALQRGVDLADLAATSSIVRRGAAHIGRRARAAQTGPSTSDVSRRDFSERAVEAGAPNKATRNEAELEGFNDHVVSPLSGRREQPSGSTDRQSSVRGSETEGAKVGRGAEVQDLGEDWARHTDFVRLFSGSTSGDRRHLRSNMLREPSLGLQRASGWEANHIIPFENVENKMLVRLNMDLNAADNGIALPVARAGSLSVHKGNHPDYNHGMKDMLQRIEALDVSDARKRVFLAALLERTRQALIGGEAPLRPADGATEELWLKVFERIGNDIGLVQK